MSDNPTPQVLRVSLFAAHVCVPADYTDQQVEEFVNKDSPTGIASKWRICRNGHAFLGEDAERVVCEDRKGCVHMLLSC